MTLLEKTCAQVMPACVSTAAETQKRLDFKTKPRGSLGRLEELACRLASVYRTSSPVIPAKAVVVMAADHGVATEGVSAYPQEVTRQMVANFVAGGAAINVLARQSAARIVVVDMGIKSAAAEMPNVLRRRLGSGTANFARLPAMSRESAVAGIESGIALAYQLADEGINLLAIGEMGIGNTTSASAIAAAIMRRPALEVTGRGTGIDDDSVQRKAKVIEKALALHRPKLDDPLDVLSKVGGFEIAGLTGLILGAAARRIPVVLDGFITGAAALIAAELCPSAKDSMIASHCSVEPGHALILKHLNLNPLLNLNLRLGEGTGAVLAMNLIDASLLLSRDMATFAAAGVSDTGA